MTTKQIQENGNDITLDEAGVAANQSKFCDIWPSARQGLEMLKDLTKNPLVNPSSRL